MISYMATLLQVHGFCEELTVVTNSEADAISEFSYRLRSDKGLQKKGRIVENSFKSQLREN